MIRRVIETYDKDEKNTNKIKGQDFSRILILTVLCFCGALSLSQNAFVRDPTTKRVIFKNEAKPVEKRETIGFGSTKLEGSKTAEVFTYQTWTIVYTPGKVVIKLGGGIRIGIRHMCHLWSAVQKDDPKLPGYLTAKTKDNLPVNVSVECHNWSKKFSGQYFS